MSEKRLFANSVRGRVYLIIVIINTSMGLIENVIVTNSHVREQELCQSKLAEMRLSFSQLKPAFFTEVE